jgi:diguanylate cyclase (GGDEF)-like protein
MDMFYGARPARALMRFAETRVNQTRSALASLPREKVDVIVLSLLGVAVMIVEYCTDIASTLFQFAIDYQTWEIDNVVFVILLMSLGLLYFSYRRMKELKIEVEARHSAELKAAMLARHDPLTGLPNRRYYIEVLRDALLTVTESSQFAVLMLDLDGFKSINDAYGHPVGDRLLIDFAKRISANIGPGATLNRIGGDEFAVVFPDAGSLAAAVALARHIVAEATMPFVIDQISASVGVCVGIAIAPQDGMEPELLVRRADRALYRAKSEGRSCIRFFEPEMDAHIARRIAMEAELRVAIVAKRIIPHYQPVVFLKSGRVVGFEALARWRNDKGEWVAPDLFIPMAEELGLISTLSDQLLRHACLDARAWPPDLTLAFNLSAKQLSDPALGLRILKILAETGFSPRRLEVEITETAVVENLKIAQKVTSQLRQAGVRIALDDFGTGYSTFSQLLSLKLDRIKIDRSFVDSLGKDNDRTTIVRALLGLANGFKLATTAEGIESEDQLAILNADGCLEGQGYLFSKAVPAEEVALVLMRGRLTSNAVA